MRRFTICRSLFLLAVALGCAGFDFANSEEALSQDAPEHAAAHSSKSPSMSRAIAAELAEIRRAVDGVSGTPGVSETHRKSVLASDVANGEGSEHHSMFRRAVERLARSETSDQSRPGRQPQTAPADLKLYVPAPTIGKDSRINALRGAASKLDQTADSLEKVDLYAEADALRAQADGLRLTARTLCRAVSDHPNGLVDTPPVRR